MHQDTIEHFVDEGLIEDVVRPLKHGKEASVHLVRANSRTTGHDLLALKIYHPLDRRDFRDESLYRDGEFIKERRIQTALQQRSRFGRQVQGGLWVSREWETLRALAHTAVPVPRPIATTGTSILMTYVGDDVAAAPRLHECRPDRRGLAALWQQLRSAIHQMLYLDIVHADLSAFNVLVLDEEITIIDFPQAVDAKVNSYAEDFLTRDIQRIGQWFDRRGYHQPWNEIAAGMWAAWQHADLLPEELRQFEIG